MCNEFDYVMHAYMVIFIVLACLGVVGVAVAGYQILTHKPYTQKDF